MKIRVGFGFDVHQLVEKHPFILGGVNLEHHAGAFGHSDADVLVHAICDALLGAGWTIGNIDAMICLEAPKINPHVPAMIQHIASAAGISEEDISIKATTNETMGFIGRQEGIVAYAVCLIEKA